MPLRIRVFAEQHLVLATGHGKVTDDDIFRYQHEFWTRRDVAGFDEIVDMTQADEFDIPTPERLQELAEVSAGLDPPRPADALWVPGGDPGSLARIIAEGKGCKGSAYLEFLKDQAAQSQWVCSVCEGALLLAAARLLDGFRVTTHWAFIPYLIAHHHPDVVVADGHPRFVIDRNRITGGGISSGLDEALKLIELLAGRETAISVQQVTQYYPEPPVASAIPNVIETRMLPPTQPTR